MTTPDPGAGGDLLVDSRPHYSALDGDSGLPGVTVRRLPSIPTKHLDAISHTVAASFDVLRREAAIVHYHALGPGLLSGVPRWLGRRRTVVTVHGLDWQREKWGPVARGVLRAGEWASAALPDRTIVVSKALAEHYRQSHHRRVDYIPNGIGAPTARAPEHLGAMGVDRPFVLFVARLVPEKGCHLLLEAWQGLPADLRAAFRLVVAGDAGFTHGYADRLRREAPADVLFPGFVNGPRLEELYSAAAVMVLPSTLEGLSISLLEAMSYGRCCLVSDIPPNLEAGGDAAASFRSGDAGDLRRELVALLRDEPRRQRLGLAAQAHARENYDWDRVAADTAALYRQLLAGSSKSI